MTWRKKVPSAWWAAIVEQYTEDDLTVGLSDLYSETPTRHEVRVDGRIRYAGCVLNSLQGAVFEDQDTVTVRSVDPVVATPVTITISDDAVAVSPEGALISFGSSLTVEDVEAIGSLAGWSLNGDGAEIQNSVCQYTNAFESEATYEQWAAETESISAPARVVSLARKTPRKGE